MLPRFRIVLLLSALVAVPLAGCLAPASQPLAPGVAAPLRTIGGSSAVPDIVAQGAEVIKHADAAELVWKSQAAANPGLGPGVPVLGTPRPLSGTIPLETFAFTLPVEVTHVNLTLSWTDDDVDLDAVLYNGQIFECGAFRGPPSALHNDWCDLYLVGPRQGLEEWKLDVINYRNDNAGAIPYEIHLLLSVKPFELAGPALTPAQRSSNLAFASHLVDGDRHVGEPSLKVDGAGNAYIAAPIGPMQSLWRTTDGGASFDVLDINGQSGPVGQAWANRNAGGGDAEVFVTDDGKEVYFADLWGTCLSVASSADAGASWNVNPLSCDIPGSTDRQWLWARPGGHLWMAFNEFSPAELPLFAAGVRGPLHVMHSTDGGQTWPVRVTIPEDDCARGNIAGEGNQRLYVAGCNQDGPGVASSEDGGTTFTWHNVAKRSGDPLDGFCYPCGIFTVVDTDSKGNLYVVWADPSEDGQGFDIWLSTSQDHATTWSTPLRVNQAQGNAIQPWIAAGEPGHVAIAWYQTAAAGKPSEVAREWYVHLAESVNALADAPAFAENVVREEPIQYGPICLNGASCAGARNLLDFLMVDIGKDGRVHIAFIDGGHGGSALDSNILYARAEKGLALADTGAAAPAASAVAQAGRPGASGVAR